MESDRPFRQAFAEIKQQGWIASCEHFDEMDSTNDYLKRLIAQGTASELPLLAVANRQTAGRGRGSNAWWSPEGVLAFSVLATADSFSRNQQALSQLALVVAIAVADMFEANLTVAPMLKWPNDVYVAQKKLCGILIETLSRGSSHFMVLGVGMNVAVNFDSASEEVRNRATSAHHYALQKIEPAMLLPQFFRHLASSLDRWRTEADFLEKNFRYRDYLLDQLVQVQSGATLVIGRAKGVDQEGALLVQAESGAIHKFISGTVRLLED